MHFSRLHHAEKALQLTKSCRIQKTEEKKNVYVPFYLGSQERDNDEFSAFSSDFSVKIVELPIYVSMKSNCR